jgi:hypothetical protein
VFSPAGVYAWHQQTCLKTSPLATLPRHTRCVPSCIMSVLLTVPAAVVRCCALQEESIFVGRVVCEVEGGSLNDTAVVLEGDTGLSEGARAALDLSQLSSYRLFPGQVRRARVLHFSSECGAVDNGNSSCVCLPHESRSRLFPGQVGGDTLLATNMQLQAVPRPGGRQHAPHIPGWFELLLLSQQQAAGTCHLCNLHRRQALACIFIAKPSQRIPEYSSTCAVVAAAGAAPAGGGCQGCEPQRLPHPRQAHLDAPATALPTRKQRSSRCSSRRDGGGRPGL